MCSYLKGIEVISHTHGVRRIVQSVERREVLQEDTGKGAVFGSFSIKLLF